MPIMDRYILKEMMAPLAFGIAAFLLFWFINTFFLAADYVINKGAPFFLVLRFLTFRVPQATPLAVPFACLMGTLMGFARLTSDNEIAAMRTSGISFARIARTPLLVGFVLFVASYWLNERIVPLSTDLSTRTLYQIVYRTTSLPIEPQIFRRDPSTGKTFYIDSVDPDGYTMHNVEIWEQSRRSAFPTITTATVAKIVGSEIVLKNATISRMNANGSIEGVLRFEDVHIPIPLGETSSQLFSPTYNDPYTMDSKHLATDIAFRKATGQDPREIAKREITLAQKLASPFSAFIAVIIAMPLAVRFGKRGRALGIALTILILFLSYVLNAMAAAFGQNSVLNPYLAAWIPNILFAAAGSFLIFNEDR
jgi:lipopolysaccharide export system permease protein